MKLENQVAPLPQSKRLQELGIVSPSDEATHWIESPRLPAHILSSAWNNVLFWRNEGATVTYAPNVAELGVMLPNGYDTMRVTTEKGDMWRCYNLDGKDFFSEDRLFSTEAEARGEMLITLLAKTTQTCCACSGHGNAQGGMLCPYCSGSGVMTAKPEITAEEANTRLLNA